MLVNTGIVPLRGVTLVNTEGVGFTCPRTALEPGEAMSCTGQGTVLPGQHCNTGHVTSFPPYPVPNPIPIAVLSADSACYFGE